MNGNLSPKEQYELRKQEKQKSKPIEHKSFLSTSKIIWIVIIIALIAFIAWRIAAPKPERIEPAVLEEGTELGEVFSIQAVSHFNRNADHEAYNSNPPTGGPHEFDAPTPGYYKNGLRDEEAVHGLEHGYIWISYTSAVDEETFDKLRAIQKRNPGSVMLSPRDGNDSPIVLASWGRLLNMDEFDEATINTYIKNYINQSPEPFAR
jgi:hypothetical protein